MTAATALSSRRRIAQPNPVPAIAIARAGDPRPSIVPALALLVGLTGLARASWGALPHVPAPVHALLIGIAFGNLAWLKALAGGRELPYELPLLVGLVLVGAQVHGGLQDAISLAHLVPVVAAVALFVSVFAALVRVGWLPRRLGALAALGLAGFGVSAVTAVAATDHEADGELATYVTTVILLTGALGLLLVPAVAVALDLSADTVGVVAGATIANTAEAVAAAAPHSPRALHLAATVKLGVNALQGFAIVIYLWVSLPAGHPTRRQSGPRAVVGFVPPFVWGFLVVATIGALGAFTAADRASLHNLTRWLFLAALVGVGFRTRPQSLRTIGWKPALLAALVWLVVSCLVFVICLCCRPVSPAACATPTDGMNDELAHEPNEPNEPPDHDCHRYPTIQLRTPAIGLVGLERTDR